MEEKSETEGSVFSEGADGIVEAEGRRGRDERIRVFWGVQETCKDNFRSLKSLLEEAPQVKQQKTQNSLSLRA